MNLRIIYRTGTIFVLMPFIFFQDIEPSLARTDITGTSSGVQSLDIATIERLTGVKGKLNEQEGVFKVSVPRTDLQVTAAGVRITPPMGLTSWAAFMQAGDQILVMGDIVLLEEQVNPVMSVALDYDLEVTALHNHFFWDSTEGHVYAYRWNRQ